MDKIASIEEILVGMTETSEKIISESDINLFADISGDHNLVHIDV
jgi:acyl dehydratase